MRISFDLDDTLVLKTVDGPREEALPPRRKGVAIEEWLRKGTFDLLNQLQQRGWEILIYTNSYRGKSEIADWFAACGLTVCGVVNQQLHEQKQVESGMARPCPSKFPPWFHVDIHVDDSLELYADAQEHGFVMVRVAPDDPNWTSVVLKAVENVTSAGPRRT